MSDATARLSAALADRYKIERKLGEGGMATVYLAEDIKHERKVAIKILRPELAAVIGAERFLAEIKTTANLQHPHILPLFDSGEADSFLYYVMPHVAGENLRERIEREQQLGVDEAVKIARGVAEALDYAHRAGVIHRDIKPANILLHDGNPVVADFGIALAVSAAGGGRMTETGLSLGTPHYMSPEQASADRDLSARSDVYSLGCVLYEMLAGQPPHTGPSAQSILVRILTEDPRPVTDLRRSVPPHVGATVMKSIEKLPADRFETARHFIDALGDDTFAYTAVPRTLTTGARRAPPPAASWVADVRSKVAVALVAVFAAIAGWSLFSPASSGVGDPPIAFRFQLADSLNFQVVALSPDGTVAIYTGGSLSFRRPGSTDIVPVPNTDGARFAAFSPEGDWLAYSTAIEGAANRGLFKQPVRGGEPIQISALAGVSFFLLSEWASDGRLYGMAGSNDRGAALVRVSDAGGAFDTLQIPTRPGRTPMLTTLLPGGESVLFSEMGTAGQLGEGRVMAFRLETGDTIEVVPQGAFARWLPTGHLLYSRRGGFLEAVPFDPDRLRVLGPAVPVLSGVAGSGDLSFFYVNNAGTLVYTAGEATGLRSERASGLVAEWVDLNGNTETLSMRPTDHTDGSVSPDGRSIAYIREERVWIYDVIRGSDGPLRDDELGSDEHNPMWSPNGTELVFSSIREGSQRQDIYRQVVEGDEAAVRVGGTAMWDNPFQWLPDGTVIFQATPTDPANVDLYSVPADGSSDPVPLLDGAWREDFPQVSPDGRWLAYRSSESGTDQAYVRRWPELDGKVQVSELNSRIDTAVPVEGAAWSGDSRTLYYQEAGVLMAAELDTSDGARVQSRRRVLERAFTIRDVHPDGRFLRFRRDDASQAGSEAPRVMIVTNWFTELRERLGVGN